MSGIIAVYALVVAVLIAGNMKPPPATYSLFNGCMHLACGLSVGLTGLAAGYAIGTVGDTVSVKKSRLHPSADTGADRDIAGRKSIYAAVKDIRGYGTYIDLWRGVGVVWVIEACR